MQFLVGLTGLRCLHLHDNWIHDKGLQELTALKQLTGLQVEGMRVDGL